LEKCFAEEDTAPDTAVVEGLQKGVGAGPRGRENPRKNGGARGLELEALIALIFRPKKKRLAVCQTQFNGGLTVTPEESKGALESPISKSVC